jgi:hypothetical protein
MSAFSTGLSLAGTVGDIPGVDLIPGAGVAKTVLKGLSGLFGGSKEDVSEAKMKQVAADCGYPYQDVYDLCWWDQARTKEGTAEKSAIKYASNNAQFRADVMQYNIDRPDRQLHPVAQALAPAAVPSAVYQVPYVAASVPAAVEQLTGVTPKLASNFSGTDLKDLGTAILKGAQGGATEWGMNTPAGKQAKSDGFQSWLKDNQLYVFAAGLAVLGLIYKAFFSKK